MSAIEKFNHEFHEYERSKANKSIYRCVHPQCTHYQKREYLVGKYATCPKCKNRFTLSWDQLRNKTPVCEFCSRSPKSDELRRARDLAFKALDDLPEEIKKMVIEETLE